MQYKTIVSDPPWLPSLHKNTKGRVCGKYKKGPQGFYPCLDVSEICKMIPPSSEKSHLWLWVLNQHVDWGYLVARSWGFEPQQMLTWAKPGLGTGQFQCNSESVLICRKGGPSKNSFGKSIGTWFNWPRGRHSEKPDEFYGLVERVSNGPYLEMFARTKREGWDSWGNEVDCGSVEIPGIPLK